MIKITGNKSTIKFVPQEKIYGTSYEDIPRRVPDNTKMKTVLKVNCDVSLEEGLKKTIEWFQKAHFDAAKMPLAK